jgi:hypothetical protein
METDLVSEMLHSLFWMETDSVSKMLHFLIFKIPEVGQGPETGNSQFYKPLSKTFRIY